MTNNADIMAGIKKMVSLEDTGMPPGELFRSIRENSQISLEQFARDIGITVEKLRDIESGCAPFPTVFLIFIFTYGIPAWYWGDDADAYRGK